jgi:hypothetical protein
MERLKRRKPLGKFAEVAASTTKPENNTNFNSRAPETSKMTNLTVTDSFRSLEAEVRQLREHVQIQARHNEVIEAQLSKLLQEFSGGSKSFTISDEISPLFDGVCLNSEIDGEKPYQWVEPAFAHEAVPTDNDWWPTNRKVSNYLVPNSGWQNHSIQGDTSLVIGFSMFGLEREKIEEHVDQIRHQQSVNGDFVPIFLTDSTCFDVFRRYGFVIEYFPSPEKRMTFHGAMDWGAYAEQRLGLLIRKWGIAKMIVFGERTIMTDTPINPIADNDESTQLVLAEVA